MDSQNYIQMSMLRRTNESVARKLVCKFQCKRHISVTISYCDVSTHFRVIFIDTFNNIFLLPSLSQFQVAKSKVASIEEQAGRLINAEEIV